MNTEITPASSPGDLSNEGWQPGHLVEGHDATMTSDDGNAPRGRLPAGPVDRQIAEHCGVGHSMVSEYRNAMPPTVHAGQSTHRTGRDGRTRNVTNIGKRKAAALGKEERAEGPGSASEGKKPPVETSSASGVEACGAVDGRSEPQPVTNRPQGHSEGSESTSAAREPHERPFAYSEADVAADDNRPEPVVTPN
jgi:hypothetical protein